MATILLIHGAYQGGWIWTCVAARLHAAGHLALAPTLDGCAERHARIRPGITTKSQAEELAARLFYQGLRDVVLVGTSTGGMVPCRTAELARERIRRIVLADALALHEGERLPDIVRRRNFERTDLATGPMREDAEGRLLADLDPEARAWALARYTPHPVAPMEAPVRPERFWDLPRQASVSGAAAAPIRPSRASAGPPRRCARAGMSLTRATTRC